MNFNLIISTGSKYEDKAEAELWFNFLGLDQENALIYESNVPGLVLAEVSIEPRKVISYFKGAEEKQDEFQAQITPFNKNSRESQDNYVQFVKKIIPIDTVVPSEKDKIIQAARKLVKNTKICKEPETTFRITMRKRNTNLKTKDLIPPIADNIPNKVDLQDFDWNIQIEVIGNKTGIAILEKDDIFEPLTKD